jgi:hypothetical protein
MKFLQLTVIENETTDEQNRVTETQVFPWVEETIARFHQIEVRNFEGPRPSRLGGART